MLRNHHQDPGSELVRILRGPRPPSAATASAWQTKATGGWSSDSGSFVKTFSMGSPQRASTGNSGNRHRKGVENQDQWSGRHRGDVKSASCSGQGPTPSRSAASGPPNQKLQKISSRGPRRLIRHDVVINEAQEVLQKAESMKSAEAKSLAEAEKLLQRLRVQVPQVPRSVQELEKLVEQLQSERDGLAHQLKNQSSTRLVEDGSEDAAQLMLERSTKRRAVGDDIPTNQQDCWMVSKQLELRDDLEMGDIGIIKKLSQLISKGALRMECFPSMVSSMVC